MDKNESSTSSSDEEVAQGKMRKCTRCIAMHDTKYKLCEKCRQYAKERQFKLRNKEKIAGVKIDNEHSTKPAIPNLVQLIAASYPDIYDGTFTISGTYNGKFINCRVTISE